MGEIVDLAARGWLKARIVGDAHSPFRLGLGAQFFIPSDVRSNYTTDHTYRAMGRVLVAGDVGKFTYAGHVGVHVRGLDDQSIPEPPAMPGFRESMLTRVLCVAVVPLPWQAHGGGIGKEAAIATLLISSRTQQL